jgi:hypothetical protein
MGRRACWRLATIGLLVALAGPSVAAEADDRMTCASAAVKEAVIAVLPERLCLTDKLKLADMTSSIALDQPSVAIADTITTQITEMPPTRTCEATISFEAKLAAEAIGPGPGILYKLTVTGKPRTLSYKVGRFDDGRIYVRPTTTDCWHIDTIRQTR